MEFERLGEVWRQERGARAAPADAERAIANAARLHRAVRQRDLIETAVALILFPLFAWLAFTSASVVSSIGGAIVAAACVLIPVRLWLARRGGPDPSLPVAQALAAELRRTHAQRRLLRSVAWWYLLPLGAGVILLVAGGPTPRTFKVLYAAAVVVMYLGILWLNHRAARRVVDPVVRDLEAWLAGVNDTSSNGASDAD